jgi:hypothetical protein
MNLLTEFQYFPSVILYKNLIKVSNIVFEQYEAYQKMSFRNRCRIAGAEGAIDLSIPLQKGRDQKTLTREVRIAASGNWQAAHWKTIMSCYSRSPWFEHYREGLEGLYRQPADLLVDWDRACFDWSLRALGLPLETSLTDAWRPVYPEGEWMDWRGKLLPSQPPTLPSNQPPTQAPTQLADTGVPRYRQVFEERTGFIPGLSILDLLFCEGKRAKAILMAPSPGNSLI